MDLLSARNPLKTLNDKRDSKMYRYDSTDKSRLSVGHLAKHLVLLYLFSLTVSVFLTYAIWCLFQLEAKLVQTGSEADQIRTQLAFSNAQISSQAGRLLRMEDFSKTLEVRLDNMEEDQEEEEEDAGDMMFKSYFYAMLVVKPTNYSRW